MEVWNVTFLCLWCCRVRCPCWWQGCRRVAFLLRANKTRAKFFKLRNFVVLGGKLLQALVQKSRGKQHNVLGVQLRVQQRRAYIKCPRCQGEWQRWLKARQELLSALGRVTALLITKSILVTSDMGIQSLCFGGFYLFWPREGCWAAPLGASLLPLQLDKPIHAGSSGGWNLLHPLSFLHLFFPSCGTLL